MKASEFNKRQFSLQKTVQYIEHKNWRQNIIFKKPNL